MSSAEDKLRLLGETHLFEDVSLDDLKEVADVAHEVHFSDGQRIITEDEKGDAVYIVTDGMVKVHKTGLEFLLGAGNCVGEMALIDDQPRSASVTSIGDTTLLRIDRADFHRIIQGNVRLLQNFLKVVTGKLRSGTIREDRTMKGVTRAGVLQMSILPKSGVRFPSKSPALEISSVYHPHPEEKVMGDYYDFFPLSDHQLGMVIGDVMGHGVHTGMIVCIAKGCVHTQIRSDSSIPKLMSVMNEIVYGFRDTLSDMDDPNPPYMSFCYIVIDLQDHTISYSNAGHQAVPYHYIAKTGQIRELKAHTMALGLFNGMEYDIAQSRWGKGDLLVLYTDGIPDAESENGKPYGMRRLKDMIKQTACLSANEIRSAILADVDAYCYGRYLDDRSFVVVKML